MCALLGAGLLVGVVGIGTGSSSTPAPIPKGAPITVHLPFKLVHLDGVVVGDPATRLVGDPVVSVFRLPGIHHYQLKLTNASSIGFINAFRWFLPPGARLVKVIRSSSGHCESSGVSGFGGNQFKTVVLNPNIACDNLNLRPPTCICRSDGGSAEISFIASRDLGSPGYANVLSMTPILKIIPANDGNTGVRVWRMPGG